jgi:hypothetical protein
MAINITEVMTRIARDLNESDSDFISPPSSWSLAEILGYLNYAESNFLQATGIWQTDIPIVAVAGATILFDRPANTMDINRMGFNGKHLHRQSAHSIELEDRDWRAHAIGMPDYYHEDHLPNSKFELNKIPAAGGTIRIFADYLPDPYTNVFEDLHLKDTWEPYLRWKILALALGKKSDDQDLGRSNYADKRYNVGVQLARRLIKGVASTGLKG